MDARSDVFSLGAMLVEILSGRPLYEGEDPAALVTAAAECRTDSALGRLVGVDEDLVGACLAPAPSARPDHAGVLAERIEAHLQSVEDRARRAEVRAAETRVRARAGFALAGLIVVGLVVTMALGAAWIDERNERRLDTERRVNAAVREAARLAGQAEEAGLAGVDLWAGVLAALHEAAGIVGEEPVDAELASEVEALVAEVDEKHGRTRSEALREESHAVALERLREARIGPDVAQGIQRGDERRARESARRRGADATILAELGFDADARFDDLAASFDCTHRGELAQALDAVAEATRVAAHYDESIEPEAWRRWVRLARRFDPEDPWRNALRDELSREELDAAALGKLADSRVLTTRTAEEVATLVALLDAAGDVRGAAEAQLAGLLAHPTDFWLNVSFAGLCVQDPMMLRGYLQRAQWTARAAVALRPESARARFETAWPDLGHDVDAALSIIDELLADDPRSAQLLEMKLACLARDGRFEEAAALLPDPASGRAGTELPTPFLTWVYAPAFTAMGHGERVIACPGLSDEQRALVRFVLGQYRESWAILGRVVDWPTLGPWRQLTPVLREVESADGLAALHRRLKAMAEGDASARAGARPRDLLAAAQLTAFGVGSPVHGAELARLALEGNPGPDEVADPLISKEHMTLAAAFASGGITPASALLSIDERSALRRSALETLNQVLDFFEAQLARRDLPAELLAEIEDPLTGMALNGLLAPLRAERFLAAMPPGDAHACRSFDARIAALEAMMMRLHGES